MTQIQFSFKLYKKDITEDKVKDTLQNNAHLFSAYYEEQEDHYWMTVTWEALGIENHDVIDLFKT